MRKTYIRLACLIGTLSLALSSCQVNWFDRHYQVSWWVIAIPTVLVTATALIVAGKYVASKTFVCPQCYKTFHPVWWKAAVSLHIIDYHLFKCPHCGRRSFCYIRRRSRDE